MGKIHMDRKISKETIRGTMGKTCWLSKPAILKEAGKNIFIITFASVGDKLRVLNWKLWLFDNSLFVLQELDGLSQLTKISFDHETFWFQLHELSIRCMNRFYGKLIGNSISKVKEMDVKADDKV